jgi:hypothetical protein
MYDRLVRFLHELHTDGCVSESGVELRAEMAGRLLCRVVPYRELLHIQVGDAPTWEVRVRDEAGFLDAVDRILNTFVRVLAASAVSAGVSGAASSKLR